jgi:hypothetical protein
MENPPALSNSGDGERQAAFTGGARRSPMQFHCMIYFDPKQVFDGSEASNAVLAQSGPFDAEITASGHKVLGQPLNLPATAKTVQVRDGKTVTTDGPFMETKEMLGGLIVIEAADMDEALSVAARIPFAQLGHVEVRPAINYSQPRPVL